ncbi:carbohydrate-binding domain-containing protein [Faecalibacterium prausnitzii]|uniref:carbohydrate-binding domain-containing protein n=1 Tax=Faecalibacterium prausnitzii TaxID=853 RepID=UPI0020B703EA|nr:carbohydrate-binding domain-containing protein [Faecalibacterium prausnitzii]MCQ5155272.1 carbohydrate-binding domain-containing protein [Faecalibacterium prausnitzii]
MLSYRKLAMRVLGRPLHTGGIDSPRPASQRAAAFILTAVMLTTLAAPAFAGTWSIENGDITVKAGETGNDVTQNNVTTKNDTDTIITNSDKDTASSHTVTIETNDKNDKVEVTLDNVNIKADSGSALTSKGDVTLTLKGDNSLTGGNGGSGISSSGSLTISGGENNSLTAQGGSGSGIFSSGGVTISGGTVTANGDDGGRGISSSGSLTISGGSTVTANGGNGTISGGDGICSSGGVTISGGTVNATGGTGGTGENSNGGSGIYIYSSSGSLTVSGGTVTAKGGNGDSKDGYGGDGIRSGGGVTISGNTVNAAGGYGGKVGGYGICSFDRVAISGGTVEAAGGNGSTGGGSGIYSSVIDLSGSLELTAKAGSPNGKALSQKGSELVLDTIKDKLGPGAKVTATDANGKVNQVSIPGPVEPEKPVIPEESSSSSDGGSAAPSAPTSPLPGLTVTDKSGAVISYTSTQSGNTLTVCVGRFTASFRISLAALRQLRAEGIETITFQTILCSTTLSVDELLAMGGEDAEAVLTHRFTDSSLTVG